VTSPRGKAVHDVIRTLARRYPFGEVVIAGVQVEGEGAVDELVAGLRALADEPEVDVIILGRGGGSYEDLMPFNAEALARAIVACPVPVVTGIGHEPDTSIADMVADLRASTPTAAAEAVAPERADLERRLHAQRRLLARALDRVVRERVHRLGLLAHRPVFRDTACLLAQRMQALDVVADSLGRVLPERLVRQADAVARSEDALRRRGPLLMGPHAARYDRGRERVLSTGRALLPPFEHALASGADRLEDLSPLAILSRGYAVCYEEDGTVVRTAGAVAPGDRVSVRLAEGQLGCIVESTRTER
jgi:exodeoxyribonuclease VII large subunit